MHLLRGNIGSGLYAMGDAFRNSGLILGAVLTVFLGVVCIHNQHVLVCREIQQGCILFHLYLNVIAQMFATG